MNPYKIHLPLFKSDELIWKPRNWWVAHRLSTRNKFINRPNYFGRNSSARINLIYKLFSICGTILNQSCMPICNAQCMSQLKLETVHVFCWGPLWTFILCAVGCIFYFACCVCFVTRDKCRTYCCCKKNSNYYWASRDTFGAHHWQSFTQVVILIKIGKAIFYQNCL